MKEEDQNRQPEETTSRRAFFSTVLQVASGVTAAAILSQVLEACGQNPLSGDVPTLQTLQGSSAAGKVTITVDASSPLAAVGSGAVVQFSGGTLLVARTGQTTFAALSPVCTHQSCLITGYKDQQFVCTCHGSQFSTSGQVTRGPASIALTSYATQFSNNILTITL